MSYVRTIVFALIALGLGVTAWGLAGTAEPSPDAPAIVLASYGDVAGKAPASQPSNMSAWLKTVQARCPPGQLVFLTNACGCNGACCACSAQAPFLDHCSCRCSATQPTSCNTGFSAGRR